MQQRRLRTCGLAGGAVSDCACHVLCPWLCLLAVLHGCDCCIHGTVATYHALRMRISQTSPAHTCYLALHNISHSTTSQLSSHDLHLLCCLAGHPL